MSSPSPILFGFSLGSNLGERLDHLTHARARLRDASPDPSSLRCSSLYETDPVDCAPGTAAFLNVCLEIALAMTPEEGLELARAIECERGRPASREVNSPRPVDVDLLYAGDATRSTPELTLPHPRLTSRRFVLVPLGEIRPDLVLPGETRTVTAILNQLESAEPEPIVVARDW